MGLSIQGRRLAAIAAAESAALAAATQRAGWALAGETFGMTVGLGIATTLAEIHRQAENGNATAQRIEDACRRPPGGYR